MEDLTIIKQLLNGNHLNDKELIRADKLLYMLKIELQSRIHDIVRSIKV